MVALTFRLVVEGMRALHQIIPYTYHIALYNKLATKGGIGAAAPIATKKDATAPSTGASSSMQMQKLRNIDIISWQLYVSREKELGLKGSKKHSVMHQLLFQGVVRGIIG